MEKIKIETTLDELYYFYKEIENLADLDLAKMIAGATIFDKFIEWHTSEEDYKKWKEYIRNIDKEQEEKINNFIRTMKEYRESQRK